ncbi:MAG: hypothetical protein ABJO01_16450 [Parasphingorhabdus sp.]|uniref:hypothetical protein n=1 Tax=Parasphingorhabdus sp. TaxID=2709688 RepID=UPI00329706B3
MKVLEIALQNAAISDHKALEAIAWTKSRPFADLRRAMLFLATTFGLWGFSFSLESNDIRSLLQSISIFPFTLGVTYLFFHFYASSDQSRQYS